MNRLPQYEPQQPGAFEGLSTGILVTPKKHGARRSVANKKKPAVQCAIEGLAHAYVAEANVRWHVTMAVGVLALGVWLQLSRIEWLWITAAIAIVVMAELFNTAIERTVDLATGLRPDPLAKQAKDVAAGSVLFAVGVALVIGGAVFLPHLLSR